MKKDNFFDSPFDGIALDKQVKNPNIKVGRYSYYSGYYHGHSFDDCAMFLMPDKDDVDKLIIGSFCSIASGAKFIMAGNQGHRKDWISTFPFFYIEDDLNKSGVDGFIGAGDTVIGNDVWIGAEAMFMPGVKVGHGAIIGARAIVTKDVAPYSVVVGNPGKAIKKRFSDEQIEKLLDIKWWDWPKETLRDAMKIICSNDVNKLYEFATSLK